MHTNPVRSNAMLEMCRDSLFKGARIAGHMPLDDWREAHIGRGQGDESYARDGGRAGVRHTRALEDDSHRWRHGHALLGRQYKNLQLLKRGQPFSKQGAISPTPSNPKEPKVILCCHQEECLNFLPNPRRHRHRAPATSQSASFRSTGPSQ